MKKIRRILEAKWLVMLVWLAGVAVVWEIFAFRVEAVKRTPENIMPHIWQIVQAIFSTNTVTRVPDRTAGRSDKRRTDAGTCRTGICHRNDPGICAGAADAPVPGRGENRFTLSDYHSGHSDSGHGAHRSGDHRRYRCFPYHYRSDPDILSGGCRIRFPDSGQPNGRRRN